MAVTTGITGLVRASNASGTDLASIIGEIDGNPAGLMTPFSAALQINHPSLDVTGFAGTAPVSRSKILGLGNWGGTITGHWPTGAFTVGTSSLITLASSYAVNVQGYTLNIVGEAKEYKTAGSGWAFNAAGLVTWNATIDAIVDSSTTLSLGAAGDTGEAVTMKLLEDGTSDASFTGSAIITNVSPPIVIGELNRVQITLEGTGDLTSVAGADNSYAVYPAGVVGPAELTEIVVTAAPNRTLTGSCIWTGISLTATPGELIDVAVTVVGSGAITAA